MKHRAEFLYNKGKDMTMIYVWNGQQLIDVKEMPGILTNYTKAKIKKEIKKDYD